MQLKLSRIIARILAVSALALSAVGAQAQDAVQPEDVAARMNERTPDDFEVVVNDVVLREMNDLGSAYAGFVTKALSRDEDLDELVLRELAAAGLPPELAAIPLIETGYRNWGANGEQGGPSAGLTGGGLWQFMPGTAKLYGLAITDTTDERLDPLAATRAALDLLTDLRVRMGDWTLAIAAYNRGSGAVGKVIAAQGTRDPWELMRRGALNDYAARVMVAAMVMEEPAVLAP